MSEPAVTAYPVDVAERLRIHADAIEDGTPVPYGKMAEVQRAAVAEIEALRSLVVQAHRDSWSDEGEQMWACRGLVSLTDEQVPALLRALASGVK